MESYVTFSQILDSVMMFTKKTTTEEQEFRGLSSARRTAPVRRRRPCLGERWTTLP